MPISAIAANQLPGQGTNSLQAFREADFLSIMLAEITNQDPFEPTKTAEMVQNMQKLQELANTRFDKFRNDLRWAEDLIDKPVTIQQAAISAFEAQALRDKGINVDVGFGFVQGVVDSYRVVGEQVWLTVAGKEYPIDNVQKVEPGLRDQGSLVEIASSLIDREVRYIDGEGISSGRVTDIVWDGYGNMALTINGRNVRFELIRGIAGQL